jgi:hypothetical protein
MLTLEQFRESRVKVENLAETKWGWLDEEGSGYVYAEGAAYINIDYTDQTPYLVIYNEQYSGTLEELEEILYDEYYVVECSHV